MGYTFANQYVAGIQAAAYSAVDYVANLGPSTAISTTRQVVALAATSLANACSALEALQLRRGLALLYEDINYVVTLPMGAVLTSDQIGLVTNRISAIQAAATSIDSVSATISAASDAFPSGLPTVTDCGYLEWLTAWDFEARPVGANYATLTEYAAGIVTAWGTLYAYLETDSAVPGNTLDAVAAVLAAAQQAETDLGRLTLSPLADADTVWQGLISAPSIIPLAESWAADPTLDGFQQLAALKYTLWYFYEQVNILTINLKETVPAQVSTARVRQGDTIMAFAARELGDYTRYQAIINLNGLVPPYIASVRSANVAIPGDTLFLPTTTNATEVASVAPNYETNYLGVDLYYGPFGSDMMTWTGDIHVIAGYSNYNMALGRRIQTPLQGLETHPSYGSRIPGEIGAVLTDSTSAHVKAYLQAALLSDPRTAEVNSASVTLGAGFSLVVTATVTPNGPTSTGSQTNVNEVLMP